MKRARRIAIAAVAAATAAAVSAGPAHAAPPPNDDAADATLVTPPFEGSVDTSEATAEATDPVCAGPNSHSVWYRFTAPVDGEYAVTQALWAPPFDVGIGVYTGTPGALTEVACDAYDVRWQARKGASSLIMVSTAFGLGYGSLFTMRIEPVPPPLEVTLVAGRPRIATTPGVAVVVPVVVSCNVRADRLLLTGTISQRRRGREQIAYVEADTQCPAGRHRTLLELRSPLRERFGRWRARLELDLDACDNFTCDGTSLRRRVRIR